MRDDDADDREFPDASDMDDGSVDDEQDLLDRCPTCGQMVYADADRCPYCGSYVSPGRRAGRVPLWVILTAVLCLAALLWVGLR